MSKKLLFLIIVIFLVILSGCWSRTELNELAIVSALAIDKVDDQYLLTVQVLNVSEIAGDTASTRVAVSTFQEVGDSIFEAIRKLAKLSPRRLYFAHLRLIVFSEQVAKEGIQKPIELFSRDHEFRTDFFLVVSKEKNAKSIIEILTAVDKIPAAKIFNTIEVSEKVWAPTKGVHLDVLLSKITAKGDNPVLTGVLAKGNLKEGGRLENVEAVPSPTTIELDHLAVFKGDKLVGWLNEKESKGYNYINDNVKGTVGTIECEGGNFTVEVINTKTDRKVTVNQGKPKISINIEVEVSIAEVQCDENIIEEEKFDQLEKKLEEVTVDILEEGIMCAKKMESDIFGFGETIHKKEPKLWNKLKDNWDEQGFIDLEVEFKANISIRRTGTIQKPYTEK